MKKHRKLWLLAGVVLALGLALLLVSRPVAVDPDDVTSAEVTFTGDSLTVLPLGDYNPRGLKHWKVTADYDQGEKTLYVTCWLKPGSTFHSFEDMELPLGEYGEIDKVVLTGGWPWGGEKVVWQGESGEKL